VIGPVKELTPLTPCRPAHAMYFAAYEAVKHKLGVRRSEHSPVYSAMAGAAATIVNDALMTPGDVIKQRLQIANSPYRGIMDCAVRTYHVEGLRAFYRSYKTTVRPLLP
jgi:solute carrier family 25 (mitochondrial iron transporter), member 28/37